MPKFRIGTDDFKELINEGGYFVDKSLFIREIIEGSKVTLLPRPRRFGKTLNMTMLRYFFEKLQITSHPDCMKHQGQYPVIYLTLKQLKGRTYEEVETRIRKMVSELYRIHAYVGTILDTTVMHATSMI